MCVCLLSCSFTHTPLAFCLSCFFFLLYNVSVKLIHIISILYFFNTYCISVMLKYHVFFCLFISFKLCILKGRRRRRKKQACCEHISAIYTFVCLISALEWRLLFSSVCLPITTFKFFVSCIFFSSSSVFMVDQSK